MKNIPLILFLISFLSCRTTRELPTVESLNINQYKGTWYEIARLPNRFENGLECVTATYTVRENGKIGVLNRGFSDEKNKFVEIRGVARVPDPQYPGRLKVRFFWPFTGDYYIIARDDHYTYALVGEPSRKYLWILSRTKELNEETYAKLLRIAGRNGFDTGNLIRVSQHCSEYPEVK